MAIPPSAAPSDLPSRNPEIPIPESDGHIAWGNPFSLDASLVDGAETVEGQLTIYPEIVNTYDEQGNLLTLKLVHHLNSPIKDHVTGKMTDTIALGSFGQNDPVRMWLASIYTADITTPDFWEIKTQQAVAIRGEGSKLRLDEALYTPFNVSFLANPDATYSDGNWHNFVKWPEALPDEVTDEIGRRVQQGEPLNCQYLAHLIMNRKIPGVENQPWADAVIERAANEIDKSQRHRQELDRQDPQTISSYFDVVKDLQEVDLGIEYCGRTLIHDATVREFETVVPDQRDRIISDDPVINLANSVIKTILFSYELDDCVGDPAEFPIVGDHTREVLTRRMYDHYKPNMTLGEFASEVYQLRLNNTDPNLREYS